jgi:hypothetical protein
MPSVSFLAQIGERSMALIRHLEGWSFHMKHAEKYLPFMSRIVVNDMPRLRTAVCGCYSIAASFDGFDLEEYSFSLTWFEAH